MRPRVGVFSGGRPTLRRLMAGAVFLVIPLLVLSGTGTSGRLAGGPTAIAPPSDAGPARPLLLPAAAPAPDSAVPGWVNLSAAVSGPAPPLALGGTLAWDPVDGEYVYFGGCWVPCPVYNATWTFSGGQWRNATVGSNSPPPRYEAAMTFDAAAGGVLLFGGVGSAGQYLNDTWLFRAGSWANLSGLGAAPSARANGALAFDPEPEENGSVLFGGCGPSGACDNSTYVWRLGSGWSPLASAGVGPSGRELIGMAYDPQDSYLLLFGGVGPCSAGTCDFNQTWELYGGTWWAVRATPTPLGLEGPGLCYDAALGKVVLFGGYNSSQGAFLNETWLFSAGTWTNATVGPAPPPRTLFAMTSDASGAPPLLFSGFSLGLWNDTWAYAPTPSVTLAGPGTGTEARAPLSVSAVVSGGSGPFTALFDFGDSTTAVAEGDGPTLIVSHSYVAAGNFTVRVNITDAIGLVATSTLSLAIGSAPTVLAAAIPAATDVGRPVVLSATLSGGVAPATFDWTFGDGAGGAGSPVNHTWATPGTYAATVNASDALGGTASAAVPIVVAPLPGATATLCAGAVCGSSATPSAGTAVQFSARVTNGSPAFTYSWVFGDGASSHAPAPLHAYATSGSYSYELWVNDSAGATATALGQVVVTPAPPSTAPTAGSAAPPLWFWAGLAAIVVVGVVAGALLVRRRRTPPA